MQFEASRGYSPKGDIAVDDISLSPECFGIGNFNIMLNGFFITQLIIFNYLPFFHHEMFLFSGVPPEVVGDFDYYNPPATLPVAHQDFTNKTGCDAFKAFLIFFKRLYCFIYFMYFMYLYYVYIVFRCYYLCYLCYYNICVTC